MVLLPPPDLGTMLYDYKVQVLCRTPLVSVVDFQCWQVETKRMLPEEAMPAPTVAFPRRGTFFRHGPEHAEFADPNFVLFFNPGDPFRISYPQPTGDDSTFFVLDPKVLREILAERHPRAADSEAPRFPVAQMLSDPDLFLTHRMLLGRAQRSSGVNPLPVEEGLLRLVARMAAGTRNGTNGHRRARAATRRAHRDAAENVKAILADRFRERLTLSEIASAARISPYHLCRIFAREIGMPIHRYLNRLRLRDSLWQLAERQTSLTDLALDLGYSSHSHFTDAFRREFGVSPTDFRRATAAAVAPASR